MFQFEHKSGAKFSANCTVSVGGIPTANAIEVTMAKLVQYYSKRAKDDADADADRGPYWTYDGRLHYQRKFNDPVKWLYVATLDQDQDVLVNFIRGHYGKEAH